MRAAIYYTPRPDSELTRLAAQWLGRDAFSGEATRAPDPERDRVTAEPARYGFHATMKAPFRLAPGCNLDGLDARLADFCKGRAAVAIDHLVLARLGSFFALVPSGPVPQLQELAEATVRAFEPCRAPSTEAEIARRRPERLSERQRRYLAEWGYPYVFEEFRFHMTLTGPVEGEAEELARDLEARFASLVGGPLTIDGLAIFVEPEPGRPFRVHSHRIFGAEPILNRQES